jgi:hypothetical protein
MLSQFPLDFSVYAQWSGILTLVFLVLTVLSFIFKWGIRFRLVGATGFTAVLTVGLFGLGLGLFTRTVVPGAVRYVTVYDSGATQVVIAVPPEVTESALNATLQQAASDLYSFGRLGSSSNQLTIRARTVIHPEPGVSKPLFLGQVKRSLAQREDENMEIEVFSESFAQIPETTPVEATAS